MKSTRCNARSTQRRSASDGRAFPVRDGLKSAAISAGVWLLLQTARGHSPAQRSRLILIGLAFVAALPVLSLLLPPLEMNVGTVTEAAAPATLTSFATGQEAASI